MAQEQGGIKVEEADLAEALEEGPEVLQEGDREATLEEVHEETTEGPQEEGHNDVWILTELLDKCL